MARLSCGGMEIWFLTARRRWSIRTVDMPNGAADRGSTMRQPQWTLIGLLTAITFDGAAPRVESCDGLPNRFHWPGPNHLRVGLAVLGADFQREVAVKGSDIFCDTRGFVGEHFHHGTIDKNAQAQPSRAFGQWQRDLCVYYLKFRTIEAHDDWVRNFGAALEFEFNSFCRRQINFSQDLQRVRFREVQSLDAILQTDVAPLHRFAAQFAQLRRGVLPELPITR